MIEAVPNFGPNLWIYLDDGDRHELALKLTLKMPDFGISIVRDIVSALSSAIPVVPATTSVATSTGLYFFRLVM